MKEFIRLLTEDGDVLIKRIKDIDEVLSLDEGKRCRIWWKGFSQGEEYNTSFIVIAEYLGVNET